MYRRHIIEFKQANISLRLGYMQRVLPIQRARAFSILDFQVFIGQRMISVQGSIVQFFYRMINSVLDQRTMYGCVHDGKSRRLKKLKLVC